MEDLVADVSSDSSTTPLLYSMLDDRLSFHRQSKNWISLDFDVNLFFSPSIVFHSPPSTYISRAPASATLILDSSSGPTSHATFLKSFSPYARRLHGYLVKEQMSLATMFVVNEVVITEEKFKTRDSIAVFRTNISFSSRKKSGRVRYEANQDGRSSTACHRKPWASVKYA